VAAPSALALAGALTDLQQRVRAAAFRALLARRRPVTAAGLAASLGADVGAVRQVLETLARADRIRLDAAGRVVGSCGLSVVPHRHELRIGRRRYWTWCALDAVGILGAVGADGRVLSADAEAGGPIEVRFRGGEPTADGAVVFLADESCCPAGVDSWCPKVNFFADAEAARAWAEQNGLPGEVVGVREATRRGAAQWRPLVAPAGGATGAGA
jgi:hypothetical protein